MSEKLAEFLNRRHAEMCAREGRVIPWSELAGRGDLVYTNLVRWKNGGGMPIHFEDKVSLAKVFGDDILKIPGMEVNPRLAWFWNNRHDPVVDEVLGQAKETAERRMSSTNVLNT